MKYLFMYRYNNIRGGIQGLIRKLGDFFVLKGNRVYVLSDHADYKKKERLLEDNLEIFYWNKKNILNLLFEKEIDIICVFEPYKKYILLTSLFKIIKRNVTSILIFCGSRSEKSGRFFYIFSLSRLIFKIFDGFIAISKYAQKICFRGKFLKKIRVIYIPVELEKYKPTSFRRYNILSIGRICKRKNYEDLIEIFDRLLKTEKNLVLDIIGGLEEVDVPYFEKIKKLVVEKKLQKFVNFYINVSEDEKLQLLSQSTLYVTTSQHEMFGITTVEALASEIPIVAYKNTATEEIVSQAKGVLVEDGNIDEMVKQIRRVLINKEELKSSFLYNKNISKIFDGEKLMNMYEQFFYEVTKKQMIKRGDFKFLNFQNNVKRLMNAEGGYIWREFKRLKVKRVLDVGCGEGFFLALKPDKTIGIDRNKELIKLCKERKLKAICVDIEKRKLPFEDSYFDGAVLMRILEHLYDPKKVLGEINRVLKMNSLVFVIVPTKEHENYWKDYSHIRPYSLESLLMLAKDTGFEIDEYFYTGNGIPLWGKLELNNYVNPSKIRERLGIYHKRGNIWAILRKTEKIKYITNLF